MSKRLYSLLGMLALVIVTSIVSFTCGQLVGPTVLEKWLQLALGTEIPQTALTISTSTPAPTQAPSPQPAPTATEILPTATWVIPIPSVIPTSPPPPLPSAYQTLNVNIYPAYTIYWKRALWESAVSKNIVTEDFERDTADYGALSFPYLTGNGFLLEGQSTAQILRDSSLLPSGNFILLRTFKGGLTFGFPNNRAVNAFGFDYKTRDNWQMTFNDSIIPLPAGRPSFIGVVIRQGYPNKFALSCAERIQSGLAVDNISYVPTNPP